MRQAEGNVIGQGYRSRRAAGTYFWRTERDFLRQGYRSRRADGTYMLSSRHLANRGHRFVAYVCLLWQRLAGGIVVYEVGSTHGRRAWPIRPDKSVGACAVAVVE